MADRAPVGASPDDVEAIRARLVFFQAIMREKAVVLNDDIEAALADVAALLAERDRQAQALAIAFAGLEGIAETRQARDGAITSATLVLDNARAALASRLPTPKE